MRNLPSKEVLEVIRKDYPVGWLEVIRKDYPVGCRVELVEMNDVQAPPVGTKGTVTYVDDIGSIFVRWDNGSGLAVAYGEDKCRRV